MVFSAMILRDTPGDRKHEPSVVKKKPPISNFVPRSVSRFIQEPIETNTKLYLNLGRSTGVFIYWLVKGTNGGCPSPRKKPTKMFAVNPRL
jgi:hypothetical protein